MEIERNTSILVPCRNESGNLIPLIEAIIGILNTGDEVVIIEGGSSDSTYEEALDLEAKFPTQVRTLKQDGVGKFNAVIVGVQESDLPIVMIWDADGTVNFEQNHEIYLHPNRALQVITGDRLRGRRDKGAMRFANFLGNWAFAITWSVILNQRPIDLLCGTKKFPRFLIADAPTWMLALDPFGDFSILAMAKHKRIKITSVPVHYHSRSYGKTNIRRWRDGIELLKVTIIIFTKLKFKKGKND
jgi:glycosyltransferase involved in cell wall biosynthesis